MCLHIQEGVSTRNWNAAASLQGLDTQISNTELARGSGAPSWVNQVSKASYWRDPPYIHWRIFHLKPFTLISQRREQDQDACWWVCKHCFLCADLCGHPRVYALRAYEPTGINALLCYCLNPGTWKCSSLASITLLGGATNTYHCQKHEEIWSFKNHWCHSQSSVWQLSSLSNQPFLNYLYQLI